MAHITLDIPLRSRAKAIAKLKQNELATLTLLLSPEGKELLKRKAELDNGTA